METIDKEKPPTETTEDHYVDKLIQFAADADLKLTAEHILTFTSIFIEKRNVLVTGGAGVGKTTFIKTVVMPMLNHLGLRYGVTATTGIAGSHLEGQTLNSWIGFGYGTGDALKAKGRSAVDLTPEELQAVYNESLEDWYANTKMVAHRKGIMARLNNTDVLLIDEISMCGGMAMFGYVDFFLRHIRGEDHKPFGGMQLILMGDFAQLPPVDRFNGKRTDWAFMCPSWRQANIKVCNLTEVFRQEDKVFAGFLNRRRVGIPMTDDEQTYVRSFVRIQTPEDVKKASYLVATNREADSQNDQALKWYPGPTTDFPILYHIPKERLKPWENESKVQKALVDSVSVIKQVLKIRIGMPVLFTNNSPDGEFVNGTKGFVHRINFDHGNMGDFCDNTSIVVKVASKDGNEKLITVQRKTYSRSKYEDPTILGYDNRPFYPAMRQFPLIPATAITVHKSQGMSLDECSIDLSRSFAPGHVYVALSRLRSAEGLTLLNDNFKVRVDPDVVDFYRRVS